MTRMIFHRTGCENVPPFFSPKKKKETDKLNEIILIKKEMNMQDYRNATCT